MQGQLDRAGRTWPRGDSWCLNSPRGTWENALRTDVAPATVQTTHFTEKLWRRPWGSPGTCPKARKAPATLAGVIKALYVPRLREDAAGAAGFSGIPGPAAACAGGTPDPLTSPAPNPPFLGSCKTPMDTSPSSRPLL